MKKIINFEKVELSLVENEQERIEELISSSKKIDICSAWVTKSVVLDKIRERMEELGPSLPRKFLRIISGINSGGTDPAIFDLGEKDWKAYERFFEIKIPNEELYEIIFHPKLYIFYDSKGSKRVLIGSMNFTNAGLSKNKELLVELKGKNEKLINWFEEIWENSHKISQEEKERVASQFAGNRLANHGGDPDSTDMSYVGNRIMEGKYGVDWPTYKANLQRVAPSLNTFSETILGDQEKDPWTMLFLKTKEVLSHYCEGWKSEYGNILAGNVDPFKFIGPLGAAGSLCSILVNEKNPKEREKIIEILLSFQKIKVDHLAIEEKVSKVVSYLNKLDALPEIGIPAASRFLAIVRPDLAFSYNGGSVRRLNLLLNLKGGKPTVNNYIKLLGYFYSTKWYNSACPRARLDRKIWESRLALIDILVYDPWNSESSDHIKNLL